MSQKRSFVYSRRWMAETPHERAALEAQGRKAVVRLKMPREGTLLLDDLVRGRVEFQWDREQDHVIQRTDGSCLYHLASVVDDHDFQITHVIRAEEHLSNTPRQVFIAQALGYELPQYAHLPYVAEPGSHNKLSKRKLDKYRKNRDFAELLDRGRAIAQGLGLSPDPATFNPVIVDFYQQIGFLPAALLNYLALLGWSLDDKREDFTLDELVESFSLERVNKAPASFDPKKLLAFQDRSMQRLPIQQKLELVLPYLAKAGLIDSPPADEVRRLVQSILAAAGDRIKLAGDILNYAEFFLPDEQFPYDPAALEQWLASPQGIEVLTGLREPLAAAEAFDPPALEKLVYAYAEARGVKIGQVVHPLRIALTGKTVGFGLFDSLSILGKERSLARIERALGVRPT
jgi:glutamyl-tRNA synthetase